MSWEGQTLEYYDRNASTFISGTLTADLDGVRHRFTGCLPQNALILDFGCGSGRDTKEFIKAGYRVEAIDGSAELCAKASEYTGIQVRKMQFNELEAQDTYDGVWACASILHLPTAQLADVLKRIEAALKPGGMLYTSFKYGCFHGIRDGRYYTDFTEETLKVFWDKATSLRIIDTWVSQDFRTDRKETQWINLLAKRV